MISSEARWKRLQTRALDMYVRCKRSFEIILSIFALWARVTPPLMVLLSGQIISSAQQAASQRTTNGLALLANSFATEKLRIWQNRLNLQDWNISIVLAHPDELKPKTLGHIRWEIDEKRAVISVLHPADYLLPQNEMLEDMEFTVVHELIHLDFARAASKFQRREADRRKEEQAVNHRANALLKMERRQRTRRLN